MKRKIDEIDDNNIYDEIDEDAVNEYLKNWFIDKNIKIVDK
jgi:hypothetical protein